MKIIIMGNSSSGKSTLAKKLCTQNDLIHLDLDVLAWLPTAPPVRQPLNTSEAQIQAFIDENKSWVIEGCYADLLTYAAKYADQLIFMNLAVEQCVSNAKNRVWEPHKYESKAAQDANLDMLVDWITQYPIRGDVCSFVAHQILFEVFNGCKVRYIENIDYP